MDGVIVDRWKGETTIREITKWVLNRRGDHEDAPRDFRDWIEGLMPEENRGKIGYYLNFWNEDSPLDETGEWLLGFPHSHITSVGWHPDTYSLIFYLVVAKDGGEFGVGGLDPDDPYEFITPEPGMVVGCDARRWHGVRKINKGGRLCIVISGVPDSVLNRQE